MMIVAEPTVWTNPGWNDKDVVHEASRQSDNNFARMIEAERFGQLEASVYAGRLQDCQNASAIQLAIEREGVATRAVLAAQKDLDNRFQILALQFQLGASACCKPCDPPGHGGGIPVAVPVIRPPQSPT